MLFLLTYLALTIVRGCPFKTNLFLLVISLAFLIAVMRVSELSRFLSKVRDESRYYVPTLNWGCVFVLFVFYLYFRRRELRARFVCFCIELQTGVNRLGCIPLLVIGDSAGAPTKLAVGAAVGVTVLCVVLWFFCPPAGAAGAAIIANATAAAVAPGVAVPAAALVSAAVGSVAPAAITTAVAVASTTAVGSASAIGVSAGALAAIAAPAAAMGVSTSALAAIPSGATALLGTSLLPSGLTAITAAVTGTAVTLLSTPARPRTEWVDLPLPEGEYVRAVWENFHNYHPRWFNFNGARCLDEFERVTSVYPDIAQFTALYQQFGLRGYIPRLEIEKLQEVFPWLVEGRSFFTMDCHLRPLAPTPEIVADIRPPATGPEIVARITRQLDMLEAEVLEAEGRAALIDLLGTLGYGVAGIVATVLYFYARHRVNESSKRKH